jgi:hypothetical protein
MQTTADRAELFADFHCIFVRTLRDIPHIGNKFLQVLLAVRWVKEEIAKIFRIITEFISILSSSDTLVKGRIVDQALFSDFLNDRAACAIICAAILLFST